MRDSSKCAECGCDLLTVANNNPAPGFVTAMQFVQRTMGMQIFICWRCADTDLHSTENIGVSMIPAKKRFFWLLSFLFQNY
jgi:hypothetical protein